MSSEENDEQRTSTSAKAAETSATQTRELAISPHDINAPMAREKELIDADPKLVTAAMKRVMPLVRKLPKSLRLPEKAIKSSALGGVTVVHRKKNSEQEGAPVVFGGDVIIDGSFDIGCICIILGDLTVDGVIEALSDDAVVIVGGSIRARGINCTDHVHAAGSIQAEVVFVELGGKLTAGRAIEADLVVLEDASVEVGGKLKAKTKVVLTYPDAKGIQRLEGLLTPKAFGTVPGHDNLYDYTNLFSALRRGKPWRRGGK